MSFEIEKRICFCDTDAGGVVYYSRYLDFCEEARLEFLLSLGLTQGTLGKDHNFALLVRECAVKYLKPARLEELVTVTVENVVLSAPTLKMDHNIYDSRRSLLVTCRVVLVGVDGHGKPQRRYPAELTTRICDTLDR
ncbi:MAG: acyl-CoA thioesterase [Rickettsiales bacterium]|jgi:tol-pal system-associated acyl-CoA thioesterase|nr:acyl-CoA thioesterase [Rickettsiales bacterium]